MKVLQLLFTLFFCQRVFGIEHLSSISNIKENSNSSSLTITSFSFNPSSTYSLWVDRLLGQKSVFYGSSKGIRHYFSREELDATEIRKRHLKLGRHKLPEYAIWPPCSIELLGYVRLGNQMPFRMEDKMVSPSYGRARVRVGQESWPCFYRATYENWREDNPYTEPNFWATFFYCPSPKKILNCREFQAYLESTESIRGRVILPLRRGASWSAEFDVNRVDFDDHFRRAVAHRKELAVCLAIPYSSSNPAKRSLNTALLTSWLRYYRNLGAHVLIYDRDGVNRETVMIHRHMSQNDLNPGAPGGVTYFDYTIRGLLDPARAQMEYDNTELSGSIDESSPKFNDLYSRFEAQGHDKTLTLTQCRFEARVMLGYQRVAAIDFDEFFYCSAAPTTVEDQRSYLFNYLERLEVEGVEQITLPQRLMRNLTRSASSCMMAKVTANQSIFQCFAPYEFYMGGHSVKSIHLKHVCPLTNYHHSCPVTDAPRAYDCLCNAREILQNYKKPYQADRKGRECAVLHISSKDSAYNGQRYPISEEELERARQLPNELYALVESETGMVS